MSKKRCPICKELKSTKEFSNSTSYCRPCNRVRGREKYRENAEHIKAIRKVQYSRYREKRIARALEYKNTKKSANPEYYLWLSAKRRAAKTGKDFDIEVSDIVIPEYCPVLGIALRLGVKRGFIEDAPSIDRVDSEKGYVKGNVFVISWRANKIKSDASLEELEKLVAYVKSKKEV